jgi:ABC-2 type transport system ATP-binding protein
VVDKGRLIAEGTPADLKEEMGSTVLEIVLADKADVKIAADTLIGIGTKPPTIEGVSIDLHIEGGAVDAMEALRRLDQATLIPVRFALREPSLDDVFLSLTGKKAESDQGGSQP